jgi:hypothetical protein
VGISLQMVRHDCSESNVSLALGGTVLVRAAVRAEPPGLAMPSNLENLEQPFSRPNY